MTSVLISHFLISSFSQSQSFFNLTADEVRIDTLLPVFNYAYPLGSHYTDSIYEVSIEYPEFVPMSEEEIVRYKAISNEQLVIMITKQVQNPFCLHSKRHHKK